MTKLMVDGAFFQLNTTGIARVWHSILSILSNERNLKIYFLDRGNAPHIDRIKCIPFPSITPAHSADDSLLIQKVCDHYRVDLFTSTYYTTPISTPMILLVYDMIPELFNFDLTLRPWMEKEIAISYAQRYICISNSTRKDLLSFYPEIPTDHAKVAYCGIDTNLFFPQEEEKVTQFRQKFSLHKPYFMFVGSRVQHTGYKNSDLFYRAVSQFDRANFDVLCVGGERTIEPEILGSLPVGVACIRVELTDEQLAAAYSGATALVYPSLYEGFGMPVIEAMACGCPVITTNHGSLAEASGDAAHIISGFSVEEMNEGLSLVAKDGYRSALIERGLAHAGQFRWHEMANVFLKEADAVLREARAGAYDTFLQEWGRLRRIQASVDYHSGIEQ